MHCCDSLKNSSTATTNNSYSSGGDDKTEAEAGVSAQQGVNLMISFIQNTKFVNTPGWETAIAGNLAEALAIAQSYSCDGGMINNLVLVSHGNQSGAVFGKLSAGGDYLSVSTVRGATKYLSDAAIMNKFSALLGQVVSGGNVVLTACESGVNLGGL